MPHHSQARANAIRWAQAMLEKEFVVLDTETTGFGPDDEVVSIGIIDRSGATLLDTLVQHQKRCDEGALLVHGIDWQTTRQAPPLASIYSQLLDHLSGRPVLGYNASFDARLLNQSCDRYGLWSIHLQTHDLMEQFARFYGQWSDYHQSYTWQKLTKAARYFGLDVDGAHGAVADCRLTLGIVEAMAEAEV